MSKAHIADLVIVKSELSKVRQDPVPVGAGVGKSCAAFIADLVVRQLEEIKLRQSALGAGLCKCRETNIANLVVAEVELGQVCEGPTVKLFFAMKNGSCRRVGG